MGIVYSASDLLGDKERAWEALISELYASVDIRLDGTRTFTGEIAQSTLHDMNLTRARVETEFVRRTRRHIARDPTDRCIFMLVRRGTVAISQFGRQASITADCFSILDLDAPYIHEHVTPSDVHFVEVPKAVLRSRFRDIQSHCAVPRPVGTGISRIAADLITSLDRNVGEMRGEAAGCLAAQLVEILGLVFEAEAADMPDGPSLARNAIRRRALAFIDRHLGDPDLDPAAIAGAIGVSMRYLQRAFEDVDDTVSGSIRARRLAACRDKLLDRRFDLLRISDLARRHGFSNECHFAASFKKAFGLSARAPGEGGAPTGEMTASVTCARLR